MMSHADSPLEIHGDNEARQSVEDYESDNVGKKDWFGPAVASMARLNQIQTNIYNMGLHHPNVLKPTQSVRRNQQQRATLQTTPIPEKDINCEMPDETDRQGHVLSARKVQLSPIPKTAAWGSNHSIPELLSRQIKPGVTRPSSAKILNECRLKSLSMSKGRPQSAKEPLCNSTEQKKTRHLGVLGNKKNVLSSKPPKRAAKPVGKPMDDGMEECLPGYSGLSKTREEELLTAPCSSPVFSDDENVIEMERPTPIHLSLPSADDILDLNRDGDDVNQEPDTDRLLKEADRFMRKNQQAQIREGGSTLQSRNATLPEASCSQDSPHSNPSKPQQDKSSNANPSCDQNNMMKNERRKISHGDENIEFMKTSTFRDDERETLKPGVKIREDRNITVDITPRNQGRKVNDKSSQFVNKSRLAQIATSNHSTCPCDMKLSDLSLTDKEKNALEQHQKNNTLSKKLPMDGLVSMVTVEYEEADEEAIVEKKPSRRKKKPMSEIETLVSQLSQVESGVPEVNGDNNGALSVTDLLHKSTPERNYYELSRTKPKGLPNSVAQEDKPTESSDKDVNVVYKTIKTVEFGSESSSESSIRSAISNQMTKTKKEYSVPPTFAIKQTKNVSKGIKSELKSEQHKNERSSIQQTEAQIDVLEDMLLEAKAMAQNSIQKASVNRPPSGNSTSLRNKPRPSSSRPDKAPNMTKTELRPKPRPLIRASSLSDIDKIHGNSQHQNAPSSSSTQKKCFRHSARLPPATCRSTAKPAADDREPVVIKSVRPQSSFATPSSLHCKDMQSKMSSFGVNIDTDVLERALFPPSGNNIYYDIPGDLPKNPTNCLLSHYKYWLPEDYKRVKMMEKRLAQDDHIKYLQELAAKKKAKKAAAKQKGKKKGKGNKLCRRNSVS